MKVFRAVDFALPLLLCFGCGTSPDRKTSSDPGTTADESCLSTTDQAISDVMAHDMKVLDAQRTAAAACSTHSPSPPLFPPTGPGTIPMPTTAVPDAATVKSSYQAWLSSVATGITSGSLGSNYQTVAASAQGIDRFVHSCPGGGVGLPDCGTDVNCQRGQAAASSFTDVGERIFGQFKGCPAAIRQKASDELYSHHRWN
jgi:hypothetical protein